MGRDWIIDVLADLRRFARENDMPLLTAQLDEARLVAEVEISALVERAAQAAQKDPDTALRRFPDQEFPRRT